ncbi:MAG: Gfo/Idh/MocA family oxidoreductase [Eubacteriales bacterium]|nr:Gfo/Idh/MocA family oxidoreductase [Eubacteriales bacterium]
MGLNIGIIGFGGMAHWHANNASKIEGVKFVCAYDVDPKQMESAKEMGIRPCATLEELLGAEDINFVLVATPNQVHKELVIKALRAGKHVMTEKPATLSVADWDEMVAESEKAGKILTVHQNRRWDADYRTMREAVESGVLGKVYSIESRVFGTVGGMYGWRAFKAYGGGMVLDWGVHLFDQLMFMFPDKKVVDVKAELMSLLEANKEVDDYFKVMLKLEGGPVLQVEVGSYAFRALPRWYVIGDNGTMEIMDFAMEEGGITRPRFGAEGNVAPVVVQTPAGPTRMMAPRPPETREELPLTKSDATWTTLYKNLVDVVDNGAELIVEPKGVRRVLRLMELVFESAEKGHSIACEL